jgi:hypothetical protein
MGSQQSKNTEAKEDVVRLEQFWAAYGSPEYYIGMCTYVNSDYVKTSKVAYKSEGFDKAINSRVTGCTGPTGPVGPTGATGAVGSVSSSLKQYEVSHKIYSAFVIRAIPKENTLESYEKLIMPFISDYDDIGVTVGIRRPKIESLRGEMLPEHFAAYEQMVSENNDAHLKNEQIRNIYDTLIRLRSSNTRDVEGYDAMENDMKDIVDRMIENIRKYNRSDSDTDHDNSDDDDNDFNAPNVSQYLIRHAPNSWYSHTQVYTYNNEVKLEICCHENTKLYNHIYDLLNSYTP